MNDIIKKSKLASSGFTLVETILYVAIIGMIIGAFISFILVISGLRNKFHITEEIRANKRVMQEVFYHFIRNAKEVKVPLKLSSESSLDFIPAEGIATYSFFEKDGRLMLFDSATSTPLTSDEVIVSNFNFVNMSASGTPDSIRISGTIKGYASSSVDYIYEDIFTYNVSLPR